LRLAILFLNELISQKLEGEEKDFDGVEWTIEKVYDVLDEKNKK